MSAPDGLRTKARLHGLSSPVHGIDLSAGEDRIAVTCADEVLVYDTASLGGLKGRASSHE